MTPWAKAPQMNTHKYELSAKKLFAFIPVYSWPRSFFLDPLKTHLILERVLLDLPKSDYRVGLELSIVLKADSIHPALVRTSVASKPVRVDRHLVVSRSDLDSTVVDAALRSVIRKLGRDINRLHLEADDIPRAIIDRYRALPCRISDL